MIENQPPSEVPKSLHEVAELLRHVHHLGPEAQDALADLVEELGKALQGAPVPSAEMAHVAQSTSQLVHSLHQRHDASMLATAKLRLDEAAARAEADAPLLTGMVRRLIDALANLGI